ncbi:MAG: PKD domain-containing protein [Chloroflexota bacterium]
MNLRRPVLALFLATMAMTTLFVGLALAQGPVVDLDKEEEDIRIIGENEQDWMGEVTASGDVNGDGYDDLIIGASGFDYAGRSVSGAVYVIMGRANMSPSLQMGSTTIDIVIYGARANDRLGHAIGSGDLNGDNISDIIIGADGNNSNNGAVYVFLGRALFGTTPITIDLFSPGYIPSLVVAGRDQERLGRSVAGGDVNQDGYDDLIAGGYQFDPAGRYDAGAAYVIMGGSHLDPSNMLTINLATDSPAVTILGAEGDPDGYGGPELGDYLGRSVASGDLNGDGYADIIVGAQHADSPLTSTNSVGLAYVITGSTSITTSNPITYDLSTITDTARVSVFHGVDAGDETGFFVASSNLNGDSYDDLIVSAYVADAYWPGSETGEVYVVYGQATLSATVHLATDADITVYGAEDDERLGRSVTGGDINNDGYDDLVIGASWADRSATITNTGRVYVVSGGPTISTTINLSDTHTAKVRILGDDGIPPGYFYDPDGAGPNPGEWNGDELGRAVATGDINGDGAQDVIAGALWAENAAGEVYVVYGGGPITLSITPTGQTIASGASITFTVTASNTADIRDVSAKTTLTTENGAGGSWDGNVYTAAIDGAWTVTATYQGVVTTTTFIVTNDPPTADADGPYNGFEGTAIIFDGSDSTDPENAPLDYAWDLDDDGEFDDGAAATASATWNDEGIHTITLHVTDSGNLTDTDAATVTVNNVAPAIDDVSHSTPATEGSAVTVTVTASDPGSDTLTYGFDWDGNGSFIDPGDIASQSSNQASHTWSSSGYHTITIRVDDGDGGVVTDTLAINIGDLDPTASFVAAPTSGNEPLTVVLTDTSTSYDGLTAWQWSFGDGSPVSTDANPSHEYVANGVYTVTLTVWEADGDSDAETKVGYITVHNVAPSADAGGPYDGMAGLPISLSAAGSTDPGTEDVLTYHWDWDNNGTYDQTTASATITHTWQDVGTYTVTLRVTDGDGGQDNDTAVVNVTPNTLNRIEISPQASTIEAGANQAYSVTAYDAFNNSWDATDDASLAIEAGANGSCTDNSCTATTAGAWQVQASYGGQSDTATLNVTAASPDAPDHFAVSVPASAQAGQPFQITIEARDRFDNLITTFNGAVSLATDLGLDDIDPSSVTLAGGVWSGNITIHTAGTRAIIVIWNGANKGQEAITINSYRLFLPIVQRGG